MPQLKGHIKPQVFSRDDAITETGLKLRKYFDARLTLLRSQNDNDLDDIKTATLRGRIRELKKLQAQLNADPTGAVDES